MIPKKPYNVREKCSKHPEEIAAICESCYISALNQVERKAREERKQAHQEYLVNLQIRNEEAVV